MDSGDLVKGDAAERIGEPCLRIDTIEFSGLDQGIGDYHGFAAAFRTSATGR